MGRPIFYSPEVERMEVNGTSFLCLFYCADVVLLQGWQYGLPDFEPVQVPIHLRIFGLNQDPSKPTIGIPLPLMLLIELNNHLDNLPKCGEGKLPIKNTNPAWCLILFNGESLQFREGEVISPPIRLVCPIVHTGLVPGRILRFLFNVGDAGEVGVMHY